jgi:hypothetical protein
VGHVVVGEGAPLAVFEPLLEHLIAPDVELSHFRLDTVEVPRLADKDPASGQTRSPEGSQ